MHGQIDLSSEEGRERIRGLVAEMHAVADAASRRWQTPEGDTDLALAVFDAAKRLEASLADIRRFHPGHGSSG